MLTNIKEDIRIKCEMYWPEVISSSLTYNNLKITLQDEIVLLDNCIIERTFAIFDGEENLLCSISQLQVISWHDHSIPDNAKGFDTIEIILNFIDDYKSKFPRSPVVVHCSAGIGRTGTLIAIYNIYRTISLIDKFNKENKNKIVPFFSVFNVVRKLREQRYGMVTDSSQYKYIYNFLCEWISRNLE